MLALLDHSKPINMLKGIMMNNLSNKWLSVFSKVAAYKNETGHCNIPRNRPDLKQLALWVKNQRYEYRKGKMNPKKIELLESVGFTWDLHEAKWFEMLEELKRFKAMHNHTNVPQRVPEVRKLSIWVSTQRLNFKRGKMSKERFLILENLEFDWAPHETRRQDRLKVPAVMGGNYFSGGQSVAGGSM